MNGNPTKKQQDFHKWSRSQPCLCCQNSVVEIHHIKGSKMRLKGCVKPGEWYILPLCFECHRGSSGVHANKRVFELYYAPQKELWQAHIDAYSFHHGNRPMCYDVYQTIIDRG